MRPIIYTTLFVLFLAGRLNAQCDFGTHSTSLLDSWLSCTTSASPNIERPNGHWIMYDLGSPHHLFESRIWNLNALGLTGQGVQNIHFDVSFDGQSWLPWGQFQVPEAPGSSAYSGVDGPFFDGLVGRYLLMTIESNWDGSGCAGFAEIRVDIEDAEVGIGEQPEVVYSAYPNPADAQITIEHPEGLVDHYIVFNSLGTAVAESRGSTRRLVIPTAQWNSGLYFALLTDNQGNKTTVRFVVNH